jgi:branched-chain amino acid transport system permease protein
VTREPLPQVLMTIGITFCVVGVANFLFGPSLKTIPLPALLAAPVSLGFGTLAGHRLLAIGSGGAIALGLWLLLEKTRFGINLRAVVDDPAMAAALGLPIETIYALSFALAVALAAFGGVVGAEIFPIEPYYALRYMVTFLVVVSVGGAGSIAGALLSCLLLGAIDTLGRYFVPDLGEFCFYFAVIVIVWAFPRGLYGKADQTVLHA